METRWRSGSTDSGVLRLLVVVMLASPMGCVSAGVGARPGGNAVVINVFPDAATQVAQTDEPNAGPAEAEDLWEPRTPAARLAEARRRRDPAVLLTARDFARDRRHSPAILDRHVEQLEGLVAATPRDASELPELLHRLAELHLERKAHYELQWRIREQSIGEAEAGGEDAKLPRLVAEQAAIDEAIRDASQSAVQVLATLVDDPDFAAYPRLDDARYAHAEELAALGREDAVQAFARLTEGSGPIVARAHVGLGDVYFDRGQLSPARQHYAAVVRDFEHSTVYPLAVYKLGRCDLETNRPAKSLRRFALVIALMNEPRADETVDLSRLLYDAEVGLVEAYARVGEVSKAHAFFLRSSEGAREPEHWVRRSMQRLAATYFDRGAYAEAIAVYEELQALYEGHAAGCHWRWRSFLCSLGTGDTRAMAEHRSALQATAKRVRAAPPSASAVRRCEDYAKDANRVTGIGDEVTDGP